MDSQVGEVKSKTDIVDIVGNYATLKRSGRNFKALCPFHQEKTPSFMVSPELQIWHCFGACNEGGDVISFLMKAENITFSEALKELADKAGVRLKRLDFEDKTYEQREKIFQINKASAQFYNFILFKHRAGENAMKYLLDRGLNKKMIQSFMLGYSPNSWDSLIKYLHKKGFTNKEILTSGLVIQSDRGSIYDRFRSRITFPLIDHRSNIVGFSGRILGDEKTAKYINSPETLVYHKRETLYGIAHTKSEIKKKDRAIIVEGEFDMLSCLAHGIGNVVAIKGSAVTQQQLRLIKRFTNRITFALDSDFSGNETVKRAVIDAEEMDFELSAISYDFAKDPDEALQKDPVTFKKMIEKPIAIYDFIIQKAVEKNPDKDAISKKRIGDAVVPYIAEIKNPILYSFYTKRLAEVLDVSQNTINSLISKFRNKQNLKKISIPKAVQQKSDRYQLMQKFILSSIFKSKKISDSFDRAFSILDMQDFQIESYQKIIEKYIEFEKYLDKQARQKIDVNNFIEFLPPHLKSAFQEVYLFDIEIFSQSYPDEDIIKSSLQLKKLSLKKKIKNTLSQSDKTADEKIVKKLSEELAGVEKKLSVI